MSEADPDEDHEDLYISDILDELDELEMEVSSSEEKEQVNYPTLVTDRANRPRS